MIVEIERNEEVILKTHTAKYRVIVDDFGGLELIRL
jgi:hypothetical protein